VIVLPYFAERITACRQDVSMDDATGMKAGHVFSRTYEFMEHGPLSSLRDGSGLADLVDAGDNHPTFFEIDNDYDLRVAAFSTIQDDAGLIIQLRATTTNAQEIVTGTQAGINIPINRWRRGVEGDIEAATYRVSSRYIKEISSVLKPVTQGYVTLLAIDDTTKKTWFLAKYHPMETNPGYHKYRVINPNCEDGTCWTAMVKMRYVPAVSDADPLLIQNMPALTSAILMLRERDAGNLEKKIAHAKDMLWLLKQQQAAKETKENEFEIRDDFGMGDIY
jgi:hypothetical protein